MLLHSSAEYELELEVYEVAWALSESLLNEQKESHRSVVWRHFCKVMINNNYKNETIYFAKYDYMPIHA